MATVNTNDIRVRNAKNLIQSFFGVTTTFPAVKNLLGVNSDGSILGPDDYGANSVLGLESDESCGGPTPDIPVTTVQNLSLIHI